MALNRVQLPCPNYSSRGGANVRLIVLHTTEGATTYQSLGTFFNNSANTTNPTSSHVGIDDTPNTVGEYVARTNKAWTAGNANPVSVNAELCVPKGGYLWTVDQWNQHPTMLSNAATWIREEAAHYNIPLVKLTPSEAQTSGRGICQHRDLGSWGGGHVDCGDGFPIDYVLQLAGGTKPSPSPPQPTPSHPPYPGTPLINFTSNHGTSVWQQQMARRGWTITVDDQYGSQSEHVCRQFQQEKGLSVDGIVGPITWDASWTAPVT